MIECSGPKMPPKRRKGYRHKVSKPLKGQRPYNCGAFKCVNRKGDFYGFDVPPFIPSHAWVKLGMHVEKFFSCETGEDALKVQRYHFYGKTEMLGDVCDLNAERIDALGRIDLIIAGNPCQDISLANPRRRGLHGEGSSGSLFFEFSRILKFLQDKSKKTAMHLFWFLENTAAMTKAVKAEMSSVLRCEPVKLCASKFVPMRRERYFWGNIPLMASGGKLPKCSLTLQDFLKPYRTAVVDSMPTITTQSHSQLSGYANIYPVLEEGKESLLHLYELEILFGFDEHYTDAGLSDTRRRKLIGNAWSVHVIQHLLKPLTIIYALKL